jgi:uncharacterized protein
MKKRLRKKKHYGEFAEWGRRLVTTRNTKSNAESFQDAFIMEAVENSGCFCGGSISEDKVDVIVELGRISDGPDEKFSRVAAWLDARSDVESWEAGPMVDLWYGNFTDQVIPHL